MESRFQQDHNLTETKLEVEFRQILYIIKNSILYVTSSYNLSFYRAWLEKLNSPCTDKYLRNLYLERLAFQIQRNCLAYPFNKNPPIGSLEFIDECEESDVSMDNIHQGDQLFDDEPQRLLNNVNISYNRGNQDFECVKENPAPIENNNNHQSFLKCGSVQANTLSLLKKEIVSEHTDKKVKLKKKKNKLNNHKNLETIFAKEDGDNDCVKLLEKPVNDLKQGEIGNILEESSWYDLSDTSLTSIILNPLGSGDAARRSKVVEFKEMSNEMSSNENTGGCQPKTLQDPCDRQNNNKCEEQSEKKFCLKDTHYISTDWKKTIESLQLRLTETLTQNNELKATVDKLTSQIQLEFKKREQNENNQKLIREAHLKEIEKLERIKKENIEKIERSFQIKLDETQKSYEKKIQDLETNNEMKIKNLHISHDNSIKEKDKEVFRLTEIIHHQCSRISEEIKALRNQMETFSGKNGNSEKILTLKKCISKMDKLFHKSEKEYLKQIEKLRLDLDKKDKVAQIQLKSQKAELIAQTSGEKQRQFDELVNSLEVKYIKMLEYHETEVMENKREDDDKIEYLKHLLEKFGIPYNNT